MSSFFKTILFWLTLPLVIPQAWYVKKTALRLPAAKGRNAGTIAKQKTNTIRLIGIGDSVIAGVGVSEHQQALTAQVATELASSYQRTTHWLAQGENGATANDIYQQLSVTTLSKADIFLLSIGVNDVTSLTPLRRWRYNLQAIINQLQQAAPQAQIIMLGVPPMAEFPLLPKPLNYLLGHRAKQLSTIAQQQLSQISRGLYIPLAVPLTAEFIADDGYHPSQFACSQLAKHIVAQLPQTIK